MEKNQSINIETFNTLKNSIRQETHKNKNIAFKSGIIQDQNVRNRTFYQKIALQKICLYRIK